MLSQGIMPSFIQNPFRSTEPHVTKNFFLRDLHFVVKKRTKQNAEKNRPPKHRHHRPR